tara:strand:+ start:70 stop:282 length:213 start_codon:yes stop_codon:yes gene_type:complete
MAEDKKAKASRTAKPVFAVMTVRDDAGNVINLTKENVEIVSIHKNAEELLSVLDGAGLPAGSFFKRIALG